MGIYKGVFNTMSFKRFKDEVCCSNCRNQMTGFDGGFFGLPFTCECRIYGETENRKNCSDFEKKITKSYLLDKIKELEKENEQLKNELRKEKSLREYSDSMYDADLIVNIRFSNGEWKADVSVIDDG